MTLSRLFATWLKTLGRHASIVLSGTVARLRFEFFVPFVGASILLLGLWIAMLYMHERDMIESEVAQTRMLIGEMYHDDVEHDARMLETAMAVIRRDTALRAALAHRDRAALLRLAAPLNDELWHRFGITHFYFSGTDRVNLLRVHQPERHGDVINRYTTLEAERTGTTSYGVELGPLGTFTLRLVTPWYADQTRRRLIGYVELGLEINQIIKTVQTFTGVPVFVLVSKKYLKREDWEAGMRMLGRTPDWDRFPDAVLSSQASDAMPTALAARLATGLPQGVTVVGTSQAQAEYRAAFQPLADIAGRDVGQMVALIDVSPYLASSRRMIYIGIVVGASIVGLLTSFFYLLTGRIGRRIERDEKELQQLATHDGLTGLYNHRTFYLMLEDELARAQRFNRPVSLLLLDIDHFKRVNDTHGHQAGDTILKGLSELLEGQARAIDRVCRYGGEEITVMLPEIALDAATVIAGRLRVAVETQPFDVNAGAPIRITVSIGVASWPSHANSAQTLVAAADAAMYSAKQMGRNKVVCYVPSHAAPKREG